MTIINDFQNHAEREIRIPKFHTWQDPSKLRLVTESTENSESSRMIETPSEIWMLRITQAILESLHAGRSLGQLRNIVTPSVMVQLQNRREIVSRVRKGSIPGVLTAKFWPVTSNKVEVTMLCQNQEFHFPIALRIEKQATTWKVVACEIGPY